MTRPHPDDIAAVLAANRPALLGIIKAVQTPLAQIDINRKAGDGKR